MTVDHSPQKRGNFWSLIAKDQNTQKEKPFPRNVILLSPNLPKSFRLEKKQYLQ